MRDKLIVEELRLPVMQHSASRRLLYGHQIAMLDLWENHQSMLLHSRTGTGKTLAAMLPILKKREWAVAVYPTNELLRDQVDSVCRLANEEGIGAFVMMPEIADDTSYPAAHSRAECLLVPIDAQLLSQWQQKKKSKCRGETLRHLLNPDKPRIIFTNPDILFLILALRYHAEAFEALLRYSTLILDEFHLYQGAELSHALAMVALARGFDFFRRVILLTATPHPDVLELLQRSIEPQVVTAPQPQEIQGWRTAVHAVEIYPHLARTDWPVDQFARCIAQIRPNIERLRAEECNDRYLPAVVVTNSVISAIALEDRLVQSGFKRDSLAIIRGLTNRRVRNRRDKLLALGTSAIEVGVDFVCDYLVFEAADAASFLQRFGRVGRHRSGKCHVFVPQNAKQGLDALRTTVSRNEFEEKIYAWYPSLQSRPWFVATKHGVLSAWAIAHNLIDTIERDISADRRVLYEVGDKVRNIMFEHARKLGCISEANQADLAFRRADAGKGGARWLKTYCHLNTFRTSLPSVRIHDFSEQNRRGEWSLAEYDVDVGTLLRRGKRIEWNDKLGMVTIKGIGKASAVHASDIFDARYYGEILETRDYPLLQVYQDGVPTPVSDVMGRQNRIFTVVPEHEVKRFLDWRLPVFPSGVNLIAFDGAALMLLEIYRKALAGR